jgi:hypothetical protein
LRFADDSEGCGCMDHVFRNAVRHLHICGTPWDGNEYVAGDDARWTMQYVKPR